MMKKLTALSFLHLADTHLGIDDSKRSKKQQSWRRSHDFMDNFKLVLKRAEKEDIAFLIHAGDVFDRSSPPKYVVKDTLSLLYSLAKKKPVILLPGNHERSILQTGLLSTVSNLHVINRPKTIPLRIQGINIGITGFPFVRNNFSSKYDGIMKRTNFDSQTFDYRILVMHQILDTTIVGAQHYVFSKDYPNVLPLKKIDPSFDYLALGHVHTHQKILKLTTCEAVYAGSLERTSFTERYEKKGYVKVDLKSHASSLTTSWTFHPVPTREMHLVRIRLDPTQVDIHKEIKTTSSRLTKDALVHFQIKILKQDTFDTTNWISIEQELKQLKQEKRLKQLTVKTIDPNNVQYFRKY